MQAGALWRLRREGFLRAITGNSTGNEAIRVIADERWPMPAISAPRKATDADRSAVLRAAEGSPLSFVSSQWRLAAPQSTAHLGDADPRPGADHEPLDADEPLAVDNRR